MGGHYPSLSPELPVGLVRPSRTARILQPGVVLVTIVVLLLCSVIGIGTGVAIFERNKVEALSVSVGACQVFVVIAASPPAPLLILNSINQTQSGFFVTYVLLHAIAGFSNEPIGPARPPKKRLHASCFIVARLALLLWIIAILTGTAVVGRPGDCLEGTKECRLHVLDLVVANLAFVAIGILLTALEACQYPFEIPESFTTGISCRVSSFGDDLLDRSISSASSFKTNSTTAREKSRTVMQQPSTRRMSLPKRSRMPGEYPTERHLTPLLPMLPMMPKSKSRGWGEKWKHLMIEDEDEKKKVERADSAISLGSDASSGSFGYSSDQGTNPSVSKPTKRPKVVTPSSNISNQSRRSPLSRMRSAEFPDIVVQPEMRFLPLSVPPSHEWTSSKATPITKLPPAAHPHTKQRGSSVTVPKPLLNRRTGPSRGPIVRKPVPIMRRRTIDIKVPGTFIDYRLSLDDERKLEEYAKKIETELVAIAQSEQKSKGLVRVPAGPFEQLYLSDPLNSRTRYRDQRPAVVSNAVAGPHKKLESTQMMTAAKAEHVKVTPLRRLNLGNISSGIGEVFD